MPVHPVIREMLNPAGAQLPPDATGLTIQEQRKAAHGMVAGLAALSGEGPEVGEVRGRVFPGLMASSRSGCSRPRTPGRFPPMSTFTGEGGGWETSR